MKPLLSQMHCFLLQIVYIHVEWTIKYIYSVVSHYIYFPVLCHNVIRRDVDCLDILQNITVIYYIDAIMLIRQD